MTAGRAFRVTGLLLVLGGAWAVGPAAAADKGKDIAASGIPDGAPACNGCHGANGEGQPGMAVPRLAGLDGGYIRKQLAAFFAGTRENAVMGPVAKALTTPAMADLAAYYASLPAPRRDATETDEGKNDVARGRSLALRGDWDAKLPACAACHGTKGLGVGADFPALAGQGAAYLAQQLRAWKAGTRHDDPLGLMRTIAGRLDDGQIAAGSAYYAGLPASPAPPAEEAVP